jgi:hypothetical protein
MSASAPDVRAAAPTPSGMSITDAQTAVSISAMVVAGAYVYRKLSEPTSSTPTAHFVIGFAFTFVTLAVLAEAAPAVGGPLAVLVAAGDVLTNGTALFKDLTGALAATKG